MRDIQFTNIKRPSRTRGQWRVNDAAHIILLIGAFICAAPLLVVLSASFSSEGALIKHGYGILPRAFTLNAYKVVFAKGKFMQPQVTGLLKSLIFLQEKQQKFQYAAGMGLPVDTVAVI